MKGKPVGVIQLKRGTGESGDDVAFWDPEAGVIDKKALEGVDAIIHLAGIYIVRCCLSIYYSPCDRDHNSNKVCSTALSSYTFLFVRHVIDDFQSLNMIMFRVFKFTHVYYLSGENVASGSTDGGPFGALGAWTDSKKKKILDSRRLSTSLLANTIASLKSPPKVLITQRI